MNARTVASIWIAYGTALLCLPLFIPGTAFGATTSVVYQSDFTSDPVWVTDQPANFYWDDSEQALFARTFNRPESSYSPSRHYYIETTLNPKLSYELRWDINVLSVTDGNTSGVAVFGLYGDRLHGFNPLNLNFVGNEQDGTFSLRLMTLDGASQLIFAEVNPGYNYDIGEVRQALFALDTWYTVIERYDATTHTYHFEMRDRTSGGVIFTKSIQADPRELINPELQNLGISMHPEGDSNTHLGQSARIGGFTEYLIDNVTLTQIYDETYTEPSSVLFLPGIQSSRLYTEGLFGSEDRLWEPNINGDVRQLAMSADGVSEKEIYTRDVIDAVFGISDIYGSFLAYLESITAQGVISDWDVFAYDWRYAVDDVVQNGTKLESEVRNAVEVVKTLARNNNSKVTLIGHSNGGLLSKALISELERRGEANLIDRVILLASPQLGTPKAIGSVLHGYDQEQVGGLIINDATARDVIQNFPGAYGLIPSDAYFEGINYPILSFGPGTTTQLFINAYGSTIDSPAELADFMRGERDGRRDAGIRVNEAAKVNGSMYDTSRELHSSVLDPWTAPAPIEVIEIVGVGLDTVKGFEYQEFIEKTCIPAGGSIACAFDPYYEPVPRFSQYGDETVMAFSAEAYGGGKLTHYINLDEVRLERPKELKKHADITALPELHTFIGNILQNASASVPFIYNTKPLFTNEREVISVHSPVTLSLTDIGGNVVGKVGEGEQTQVRTDVPGSTYLEIGGATYIIVPSTTSYTAQVQGQGETGSYSLVIESLRGENVPTPIAEISSATVTPSMEATFTKTVGIRGVLQTDYDGDGTVDDTTQIAPPPTVTELFGALRTMVYGFTLLKVKDRNWLLNSLNKAETTGASKGYSSSAVQRIFTQIDEKLASHVSLGRVSATEYTIFMSFINQIKSR